MKISIISGGFDPIHSGHIDYIKEAKKFGDKLVVLLNSDNWLSQKKGKAFLPLTERKIILESIKHVDFVFAFEDDAKGSCINGLKLVKHKFPDDELIFCNGGDRDSSNIPEMELDFIKFQFGVGGNNKKNSSSWILKEWNFEHEERVWGKFYNLYQDKGIKIKELVVSPGKGMSFQKHYFRNEIWFVYSGKCLVNYSSDEPESSQKIELNKDSTFFVNKDEWHQITNPYDETCRIFEIQYGTKTEEEDIERLHYYNQ